MEKEDVDRLEKSVRDLKKMRRKESAGKVFSMAGKLLPKGIRHPDSMVANSHLYVPGRKGRTRLR